MLMMYEILYRLVILHINTFLTSFVRVLTSTTLSKKEKKRKLVLLLSLFN